MRGKPRKKEPNHSKVRLTTNALVKEWENRIKVQAIRIEHLERRVKGLTEELDGKCREELDIDIIKSQGHRSPICWEVESDE